MEHSPVPSHESAPPTHTHGHHDDHAHVAAHTWMYLRVGAFLIAMTFFTVFLSYQDFDKMFGGHGWNIVIAMIVATVKAGVVAAIFMHLKGERVTIWRFLFFTAFFVTGLFALTFFHWWDPIMGSTRTHH